MKTLKRSLRTRPLQKTSGSQTWFTRTLYAGCAILISIALNLGYTRWSLDSEKPTQQIKNEIRAAGGNFDVMWARSKAEVWKEYIWSTAPWTSVLTIIFYGCFVGCVGMYLLHSQTEAVERKLERKYADKLKRTDDA